MTEPVHVVPIDDLVDHELTPSCVCDPDLLDVDGGGIVWSHHSLDGREDEQT